MYASMATDGERMRDLRPDAPKDYMPLPSITDSREIKTPRNGHFTDLYLKKTNRTKRSRAEARGLSKKINY